MEQTARGGKSLIWIPGVLVLAVVSIGLYAKLGAWQEVSPLAGCQQPVGELSIASPGGARHPGDRAGSAGLHPGPCEPG